MQIFNYSGINVVTAIKGIRAFQACLFTHTLMSSVCERIEDWLYSWRRKSYKNIDKYTAVYRVPQMKYFHSTIQSWLVTESLGRAKPLHYLLWLCCSYKSVSNIRRHLSGKTDYFSFHAFDAWHSSCWLSETLHAVSKDHFFHIDKTLLKSQIVIVLNIMKLGSLKRGKMLHEYP